MAANPGSHVEAGLLRDPNRALRLTELISSYCRNGLFVDVGANVGLFSIPTALAHPTVGVICFEPNPAAIARLTTNIALNGTPSNLELFPIGLGEEEGDFILYGFSGSDLGQSSLLRPRNCTEAPRQITVQVKKLDDVLQNIDRRVEAIKIDVQGLELSVLKGARQTLEKHRPTILFEHEDLNFADEYHAACAKHDLRDLFLELGYRVYYVSKKSPSLLFSANWDRNLDGDLLAIPT